MDEGGREGGREGGSEGGSEWEVERVIKWGEVSEEETAMH